jgi:hypothetical protein
MVSKFIRVAVPALATAAAGAVLTVSPASAKTGPPPKPSTTAKCTRSLHGAGKCGTFISSIVRTQSFDSFGDSSALGNPIILYNNSGGDTATDFQLFWTGRVSPAAPFSNTRSDATYLGCPEVGIQYTPGGGLPGRWVGTSGLVGRNPRVALVAYGDSSAQFVEVPATFGGPKDCASIKDPATYKGAVVLISVQKTNAHNTVEVIDAYGNNLSNGAKLDNQAQKSKSDTAAGDNQTWQWQPGLS